MIRPAEHFVHGEGRNRIVVVDGRVCAWLNKLSLDNLRGQIRGQKAQLDQVLLAIRLAGIAYNEDSATGRSVAPQPEPMSRSQQQLNDTISTTLAAEILGVTDRTIRKAIADNRLKANRLDNRYRIHRDDLAEYRATRTT